MATTVSFDDIVAYLRTTGAPFGIGSGNRIIMEAEGDHTTLNIQVVYPWEKEIIGLYAAYPVPVPADLRAHMLELAARINWGLLFAACECNPDTGIIRFRSFMLVDDAPFHREQFATMLATTISLADRYAPAFRAITESGLTVEEALALAEWDLRDGIGEDEE